MTEKKIDTNKLKQTIPGWGSDLAPERRPGVPKESPAPGGTGAHWRKPESQRDPGFKIHHTAARNDLTPVFGATCPPRGLSGRLRDLAYGIGETSMSHWLTLMLADRIDMIETILSDVFRGRAGNPFTEMGLKVELRERPLLARIWNKRFAAVVATGSLGYLAGKRARSARSGLKDAGETAAAA